MCLQDLPGFQNLEGLFFSGIIQARRIAVQSFFIKKFYKIL